VNGNMERADRRFLFLAALDGVNFWHYPTASNRPAKEGGLAVDLRADGHEPACEYSAKWPALADATVDNDVGCAVLTSLPGQPLRKIRAHHHRKLRLRYDGDDAAAEWLTRVQDTERTSDSVGSR
jgi:hypothetical protein